MATNLQPNHPHTCLHFLKQSERDEFAMYLRQHHVVAIADDANLISEDYNHRVHIRHPGYPEGKNTLFNLLAQDRPSGGIHYGTLMTICGIIAGNSFDGRLSRTRLHQDCFELQSDEVVDVGIYYYILIAPASSDITPYPIFPSFSEWTFPHDNLPPFWTKTSENLPPLTRTYSASQQSAAIAARDRTCRLTNAVEGLEVAHIIPAREEAWFDSNSMGNYTMDVSSKASVGDGANMLLLRADVHSLYDKDKWTIVPKKGSEADKRLVFHLLSPSQELSRLYHNVPLQDNLNSVSMEYLLAAFARAIFPSLVPFLRNGLRRWLITANGDGEQEVKEYRAAELDLLYRSTGIRTPSPRRQQPQIPLYSKDQRVVNYGDSALLNTSRKRPRAVLNAEEATASSLEDEPRYKRNKQFASGTASNADNMPPTPAATHSSGSKPSHTAMPQPHPATTHLDNARVERQRLDSLREAALLSERTRSGTATTWQKETEWAESATAGSFSPGGLKRWLWVQGNDNYMEEEEDEGDMELDDICRGAGVDIPGKQNFSSAC